jgi:hypothetical protein
MYHFNNIDTCKPILKVLEILTVPAQYILSLMTFMTHNLGYFTFNFSVHGINKRNKLQFHGPIANLTSLQKGVYYASITIFNIFLCRRK